MNRVTLLCGLSRSIASPLFALAALLSTADASSGATSLFASAPAVAGQASSPVALGTAGGSYSAAPPPVVYCTGKINSLGCLPSIGSVGTASATATSGFIVSDINVRSNKPGVLLYSVFGPAANPFQGAFLCIGAPIKKACIVNAGGNSTNDCSGVFIQDMNVFAHAGSSCNIPAPALLVSGTVIDCQWWGKDFGAPFATSLSDGLEYTVGP